MLHEPQEFARLKTEIDSFMSKVGDNIMGSLDLESIQDLEFVKLCYLESMRRSSPAGASSTSCMTRDVNLGGIDILAGEAFYIGIEFISNDPV